MLKITSEDRVKASYVQETPYGSSGGSLAVHVPSFMKWGAGRPRSTPSSINKSCFINASDCKPAVSTTISTQNYITARAPYHAYEKPCFFYGTTVYIHPDDDKGDIWRLYPEEEDNSVDWP